ncbi:Substrate-binding domain-containing protein [[Mycoplasma] cavipharyngis]|uniref:substrate-binding domain-containing protein n=1 Tax=[Mycoplasma] cavipharyngis TaxID=92757 RepID=UPI003704CFC9
MKFKRFKKNSVFFGLLAISGSLILSACSNNVATVGESNTDRILVGLADPDNPRWVNARKEIVNSLLQYKDKEQKSYKVTSNITKSQVEQTNFLQTQLSLNPIPKAVVVGANDDGAATIANEAKAKNIPFIAYDRLINSSDQYYFYAAFDNAKVGELQGLWLASKILSKLTGGTVFQSKNQLENWIKMGEAKGAHGTGAGGMGGDTIGMSPMGMETAHLAQLEEQYIYALAGAPTDNNAKFFYDGAMDILKVITENNVLKNKVKIVGSSSFDTAAVANWNYSDAQKRVAGFLGTPEFQKTKAFLAPNDGMALAVINALEANKNDAKKYYITGQDSNSENLKRIEQGYQLMTIAKSDKWNAKVVAIWANYMINHKQTLDKNNSKMIAQNILTEINKDATITKFKDDFNKLSTAKPKTTSATPETAAMHTMVDSFVTLDQNTYKPTNPTGGSYDPVNTFLLKPILVDGNNITTYNQIFSDSTPKQ